MYQPIPAEPLAAMGHDDAQNQFALDSLERQIFEFNQRTNNVLDTKNEMGKLQFFEALTSQIHQNPFFQAYRSVAFELKHKIDCEKVPPRYDTTQDVREHHLNQIMVNEHLIASPLGQKRQHAQSSQQMTTTTPKHAPIDEEHASQLRQIANTLSEFNLQSGGFRHEYEWFMLGKLVEFQRHIRPIYNEDLEAMRRAMDKHWTGYRIELKLQACQQALAIRTQLDANRKKRRNFSKESVDVLNQYYFANIDHPYPDDNVKTQLAHQTGLTIAQVSNWFGNKRIRHRQKLKKEQQQETEEGGAGNEAAKNGKENRG